MPADVLEQPALPISAPVVEMPVSSGSMLDNYMHDMATILPSTPNETTESSSEDTTTDEVVDNKEPPPVLDGKVEPKVTPTESAKPEVKPDFSDPQIQSEVDRRAAALVKSQREEWQQQETQRLAIEAQ